MLTITFQFSLQTANRAFSQDMESGHPKCTKGPAQMNSNISKIKQLSLKGGHLQDIHQTKLPIQVTTKLT